MGDYVKRPKYNKGQNNNDLLVLLQQIAQNQPNTNIQIDEEKIANAVAKTIGGIVQNNLRTSPNINVQGNTNSKEEYDTSISLEKLAQSMVVPRNKNDSNFKDLGNTSISNKDIEETKNTINLLKDLDD